ncbi:unnamed protein product [Amoebophrya sp. A120]|nr:unnamed protein product [Amoebophrya sp. A120]|eukprot:GSA120T00006379001.1
MRPVVRWQGRTEYVRIIDFENIARQTQARTKVRQSPSGGPVVAQKTSEYDDGVHPTNAVSLRLFDEFLLLNLVQNGDEQKNASSLYITSYEKRLSTASTWKRCIKEFLFFVLMTS